MRRDYVDDRIYVVYRGEQVAAVGTVEECAETLGIKRGVVQKYAVRAICNHGKDLSKYTVAYRYRMDYDRERFIFTVNGKAFMRGSIRDFARYAKTSTRRISALIDNPLTVNYHGADYTFEIIERAA